MAAPPTWKTSEALPQPAPVLPGMHGPSIPAGGRYPAPVSKAGGPIGTAVLFEDEELRLWENRAPPGFEGPKHSHELDYWICIGRASPDRNHKMSAAQEHNKWEPQVSTQGPPGIVLFVKKTGPEAASNPEDMPPVVIYLCELKEGQQAPDPPTGWGASSAVVYENQELRVWDLRVPEGQRGTAPVDPKNNILHMDIRGKRFGAPGVEELRDAPDGEIFLPFPRDAAKDAQMNSKTRSEIKTHGPRRSGDTYYKAAAGSAMGGGGEFGVAGEAFNEGPGPYRGLLLEIKANVPTVSTARL